MLQTRKYHILPRTIAHMPQKRPHPVPFPTLRERSVYRSRYDGSTRAGRAPKAPLCKGSCREATEGLCGEMFPIRLTFGEYATFYCGNPSVTSVRYLRHLPLHKGGFGRRKHQYV